MEKAWKNEWTKKFWIFPPFSHWLHKHDKLFTVSQDNYY